MAAVRSLKNAVGNKWFTSTASHYVGRQAGLQWGINHHQRYILALYDEIKSTSIETNTWQANNAFVV